MEHSHEARDTKASCVSSALVGAISKQLRRHHEFRIEEDSALLLEGLVQGSHGASGPGELTFKTTVPDAVKLLNNHTGRQQGFRFGLTKNRGMVYVKVTDLLTFKNFDFLADQWDKDFGHVIIYETDHPGRPCHAVFGRRPRLQAEGQKALVCQDSWGPDPPCMVYKENFVVGFRFKARIVKTWPEELQQKSVAKVAKKAAEKAEKKTDRMTKKASGPPPIARSCTFPRMRMEQLEDKVKELEEKADRFESESESDVDSDSSFGGEEKYGPPAEEVDFIAAPQVQIRER